MRHQLTLLSSVLPAAAIVDPLPLEDQVRAVLRLITDRTSEVTSKEPRPIDPVSCPNCDQFVASARTPYCSEACREQAAFVRQFRSGLASNAAFELDRQLSLGQTLWHLLGGGRPYRLSLITGKDLAKIIARHGGRCAECGAPAVTVDHVGSG